MEGIPDRLTVVEMVHHQTQDEDPFTVETRFERKLETQEQPYSRTTTVGEKWTPLDCGWLGDNVGMLVITNKEGGFTTLPTEEERQELAKKIVAVQYDGGFEDSYWVILPGESMRGMPLFASGLLIRSLHGKIKYTISLIPR